MKVVIDNFDGMQPPSGASEPMSIELVRRFESSPDGSEYWLAKPEAPFAYTTRKGEDVSVSYLVIAPGWVGQTFEPGFDGRVNLAYVTDPSLVEQHAMEFAKADYVAIGAGRIGK